MVTTLMLMATTMTRRKLKAMPTKRPLLRVHPYGDTGLVNRMLSGYITVWSVTAPYSELRFCPVRQVVTGLPLRLTGVETCGPNRALCGDKFRNSGVSMTCCKTYYKTQEFEIKKAVKRFKSALQPF
ncbi:hypothetical protein BACERE00198_04293 [Bacillus cereus]|uniref:Uncharacterized protein n=1 Tax=Bacillus thuringiensis TaxID=1428 RepID=A0A9X5MYN7_BACTU|nr:hypothetical protein BTGOE4_60430 [Bacillus thuringiensis]SME72586.1 hypothetical protein BACERE00198_04293 [Bacillus cereus]